MWGQERGGVSGRGGWQVLWGWCSVVYLELDNAAAAARAGFGGQRYEKAEFQAKVGCLCHIALLFKTFFSKRSSDARYLHDKQLKGFVQAVLVQNLQAACHAYT